MTKTHPPEAMREALDAGQTLFGESKVQEARAKIPLCPSRARWHFIGHLQKNKIRHALPLFELIHSVDSLTRARHRSHRVRGRDASARADRSESRGRIDEIRFHAGKAARRDGVTARA